MGDHDDQGGRSAAEWGEDYARLLPTYQRATRRFSALVQDLLDDAQIDIVFLEARAKSVGSFVDKIERKHAKYENPLREITDLVALRVITYFREDFERIAQLLRQQLDVDEENSVDKTRALRPTEFGYSGVHYVIRLNRSRRDLPEWATCRDIAAEIQLRTIAQHTWAAIDHKLQYKSKREVPEKLKRSFGKLAASLESVDDEFSRMLAEQADLSAQYSSMVRTGDLSLEVNANSLAAYLNENEKLAGIGAAAVAAGWTIRPRGESGDLDEADRRDLQLVLESVGITTIRSLDDALSPADLLEAELRSLADAMRREGFELRHSVEDLAAMLIVMRHPVRRERLLAVWREEFVRLLLER